MAEVGIGLFLAEPPIKEKRCDGSADSETHREQHRQAATSAKTYIGASANRLSVLQQPQLNFADKQLAGGFCVGPKGDGILLRRTTKEINHGTEFG
jgi:hypothetical protein